MTEPLELPPGISLVFHETVTSTNDEAKLLAKDNAVEGTVIWAKEQIEGRGRMNRFWESKPGNLYSSIVLRPFTSIEIAAQLSFIPALAIGELLAKLIPEVTFSFKWPNDVLLNKKKVSGTLIESGDWNGKQSGWLVIGCGLNLLHFPVKTRFPATSIYEETNRVIPVSLALSYYYQSFIKWYNRWRENGFFSLRTAWLERAHGLHEELTTEFAQHSYTGRFIGLDKNGALELQTLKGIHTIQAGDVYFNN